MKCDNGKPLIVEYTLSIFGATFVINKMVLLPALFFLITFLIPLEITEGSEETTRFLLRLTDRAPTIGKKGLRLEALYSCATDNNYINDFWSGGNYVRIVSNEHVSPGNSYVMTTEGRVRYGLFSVCEISLDIPFFTDVIGWGGEVENDIGDLYGQIKYVPPLFPETSVVQLAGNIGIQIPTGNFEWLYFPRYSWTIGTGNAYYADSLSNDTIMGNIYYYDKLYVTPSLILSLNLLHLKKKIPLLIHVNTATVFSNKKEIITAKINIACETIVKKYFHGALELQTETRPFVRNRSVPEAIIAGPISVVPSIGMVLPNGFSVALAGRFGFSSRDKSLRNNWSKNNYFYSTKSIPFYGASMSISYNLDFSRKEVLSINPYDYDNDSIPDTLDECIKTPEDLDGFEDADGCPEYDNDNDGIVDEKDECPNKMEDIDTFQDNDGCPEPDNDGDGVADSIDACPDVAGLKKYCGCTDEDIITYKRRVLTDIQFVNSSSKIIAGKKVLDKIYDEMNKHPKVTIEVQVHTDNRGSISENSALSQSRADVLKLYLVSKGIQPNRIKALGLGSEFPIADNSTKVGRAKNRRVELRRVE